MTESKAPRARKPRQQPAVAAVAAEPVATVEEPRKRTCNLQGCSASPEWRGLCSAHRQTHRGLADPKEPK